MFQGSFKGVSTKFQGCFKNICRSFKGVSRVFPECFKEVSRKTFKKTFKVFKKKFHVALIAASRAEEGLVRIRHCVNITHNKHMFLTFRFLIY